MFFKNVYRGQNEFWQYLLGILAVILAYILGQVPLGVVAFQKAAETGDQIGALQQFAEDLDFSSLGIGANMGLFLILLTFVAAFFMLWLVVRQLHKRPYLSLITANEGLNWSKIFFGFGLWMLFSVLLEGLSYFLAPETYVWQFEWSDFWPLLVLALVMLPLQTSFEELFFRGYLMQGIGLVTSYRWIPLLLTSVLFGAMHLMNPEVEAFGLGMMMAYYISFGLFLGILTLMDDSLELALGIHAATNIFGATIVTFDGSALQTPALFKATEVSVEFMLPVFYVLAAIFIFICSRKYDWTDWSLLYKRFERQDVIPPTAEIETENP